MATKRRQPAAGFKAAILVGALVASTAVGYADIVTGDLRLTALYLVVIFGASWFAGRWVGIAAASIAFAWMMGANPPPAFVSARFTYYGIEAIGTVAVFLACALMADRLRHSLDRERLQNLNLSRYLPAELVDHLAREGLRAARGRRSKAAILFVDMRDFTASVQTMEPDALFGFLQEYRTVVSRIVEAEGGIIDKFIGDGVLAVFGALRPSPEDAAAAIRCGLRLLAAIDGWNVERARHGEPSVRIGVGIHHGEVVMGAIGDEQRLEYSAVGHAVNVCSRIERLTKKYRCPLLVSEETLTEAVRSGMSFDGWRHFIDEDVQGISGELRLAAPRSADEAQVASVMYSQR
ncbi:adenylate/guanylate cyclase domain-containing protein [uncultured Reyranella sp.]|uniref:adenylate/guanylate cyclase domain-containing protein n=1 Tax=uncultured Reyranella sp. TaxID=735512 RepID=UPI0025CDE610|nr:adenylate/guanylate cyclase domain-containing protein [uncultured Reyranella sp.]